MPPPVRNLAVVAVVGQDNTGALHVLARRQGSSWDLPCGTLRESETAPDGAWRILEEVADLIPRPLVFAGVYEDPCDPRDPVPIHAHTAFVTWAHTDRPDGLPERGYTGCHWVRQDALSPGFPGLPAAHYVIAVRALDAQAAAG